MTAGGNWGLWAGLGQGLSQAGQSVANALQFAALQKQRQQELGMQQQNAQVGRDVQAAQLYQQYGTDLPGYSKGVRQFGSGNTDAAAIDPNTGLTNPDISQTSAGVAPQAGTGPGALPSQLTPGANPAAVLNALRTASTARPQGSPAAAIAPRPASSPATATPAPGGPPTAPAAPGFDASQFVLRPGDPSIAQFPPAVQREMIMRSMIAAQTLRGQAALKGIPEAVNPDQLALQRQGLAQTGAYQTGELAARNRQIDVEGDIRKTLAGLTLGKTGESYASDFARRTQDDRKAGEIGQQLEDAYGQATGATTPDGKPNPSSLKSLIVNQIAGTEPGMQVRLGTLMFNGTGGDKSLAGNAAAKVMVAINGLPPQQQLGALHNLFGQMNATKMQRYISEYQAEAASHPEIPNYESNYLRPTMAPEFVFGAGAKAATDWKSTLADAQTALLHGADLQHVRARYRSLTGRNYDSDAGSPATTAAAPSQ